MERRDDVRAPMVRCEGVTRRFHTRVGAVVALDHVDLVVPNGSLTVIAGPSGSGKSTLLALLACLDRADSGIVEVAGRDVSRLSRHDRRLVRRDSLGIVLPQPSDNLFDRFDVSGNLRWVTNVRTSRRGRRGGRPAIDHSLLVALGVADRLHVGVRALSGGEQQRVAVAAALVGTPSIILADEPTASLDHAAGTLLLDALRVAIAQGATVVVATHDPQLIAGADDVIRLDHGRRVS